MNNEKPALKCEVCGSPGRKYFAWERRRTHVACGLHRTKMLVDLLLRRGK